MLALLALWAITASPALGKGKAAAKTRGQAPSARAISELMGKFKWGMTPDEVLKPITEDIHVKYAELIKKEIDIYRQDQLRQKETEEVKAVKDSLVKFDGKKTGWDTSIVDKEFAQRNDESMMVLWEKDQRRFLFFWNDKLYKQYIAFNAEHPVFQGKSFDDFAKLIQNRYGPAEMKMATLRTKDDVTLDHLEWPPSGDFTLWAIDQSGFYGNFCLKLQQTSVIAQLERGRQEHNPKQANRNAIIDAVTAPETVKGDPNADIVDEIVGRKATRTNQGNAPSPSNDNTPANDKKRKKKDNDKDPLGGVDL
jgi:hypothetical protein